MSQRSKYLLKNIISFAFGKMGTRLISFLLVPLYTHMLSTDEYGFLDLTATLCTVLMPILILNINESVMRFSLDEGADRQKILSVGVTLLGIGCVIGLALVPVCNMIPIFSGMGWYVFAYIISTAVMQVFLSYLRGCEKLTLYSVGNIIHTAVAAGLNVLLLVVFQLGVRGYLLAYIVSNLVSALFAVIAGRAYTVFRGFRFDGKLAGAMLRFSVVLIPNSFMWWIINSSDRVMVTAMIGAAANGVYAVAYKIPSLLTTLAEVFNWAWSHSAVREKNSEDEAEYHDTVYHYMVQVLTIVTAGVFVIIKPFLFIYVSPEYYSAWKYTPYLLIGFMFMALGAFVATSYFVHKNSRSFLISGTIGAVVNILLNFVLIPIMGGAGAALATGLSYISVYLFRVIDTRRYIKLRVLRRNHLIGYTLLVIMGGVLFWDNPIGQILLIVLFALNIYLSKDIVLLVIKWVTKRLKRT